MNEELQQLITSSATAIKDAAQRYGPDIIHTILELRRLDSLSRIIPSLVILLLLILFWRKVMLPHIKTNSNLTPPEQVRLEYLERQGNARRSYFEDSELYRLHNPQRVRITSIFGDEMADGLFWAFTAAISAAVLVIIFTTLLNVWEWIALIRPDLALAHDALDALRNAVRK